MNKLLSSFLVLVLAVVSLSAAAPALATYQEGCEDGPSLNKLQGKEGPEEECTPEVDQCGAEFWVEVKQDYSNDRVSIDFLSYNTKINIAAKEGYKIVKVLLKVDSYDQSAYKDYTDKFPGEFNPPGILIKYAKVTVVKTCTEVCNNKEATNYSELKEGSTIANNALCTYLEPETPVATPSATIVPVLPMTGDFNWLLAGLVVLGLVTVGGVIKFLARKG